MSGFDQQETQQAIALFANVAEALGVAAGMFFGIEAAVSGDAACPIEARGRIASNTAREMSRPTPGRLRKRITCGSFCAHCCQLRCDRQDLFG